MQSGLQQEAQRQASATPSTQQQQQQQQQQQHWPQWHFQQHSSAPEPECLPSGVLSDFELDRLLNADSTDLDQLRHGLHVDSRASCTGEQPYAGAAAGAATGPPKRLRSKAGERGEPAPQQDAVQEQPSKAFYHMQSKQGWLAAGSHCHGASSLWLNMPCQHDQRWTEHA